MSKKILIVDDEKDILELLDYHLIKEAYETMKASNGKEALLIAKDFLPDLLKDTLIAILTARAEDYSQIAGLNAGADDYIYKPIKPRVLISRIKALLRRTEAKANSVSNVELEIDVEKYVAILNGEEMLLPKKEFELLALLFTKPGKVFTREVILARVWGDDIIVGDRTIDVHIRKLREKIGNQYIKTVKGVGYKLKL